MSRFRSRTIAMSISIRPVFAPYSAAWRTSDATFALWISFLLGRQLTLGQEPPIHRRSTTAVRRPDRAMCHAGSFPPAPLPRIRISNSSVFTVLSSGWCGYVPVRREPKEQGDIRVVRHCDVLSTRRSSLSHQVCPLAADAMSGEKVFHRGGNFDHVSLGGKVSRIEELNRSVREVFPKCLCAWRDEEGVVLAPDGEEGWVRLAEVLVKPRIQLHIRGVVEEQIQLDLFVARPLEESSVQGVRFRCHSLRID